ncbi:hypothetical protein AB0395_02075 [Streptosporangium sp. NPDC051023]
MPHLTAPSRPARPGSPGRRDLTAPATTTCQPDRLVFSKAGTAEQRVAG